MDAVSTYAELVHAVPRWYCPSRYPISSGSFDFHRPVAKYPAVEHRFALQCRFVLQELWFALQCRFHRGGLIRAAEPSSSGGIYRRQEGHRCLMPPPPQATRSSSTGAQDAEDWSMATDHTDVADQEHGESAWQGNEDSAPMQKPAVSYVSARVSTQFPACDTVPSFFLPFLRWFLCHIRLLLMWHSNKFYGHWLMWWVGDVLSLLGLTGVSTTTLE